MTETIRLINASIITSSKTRRRKSELDALQSQINPHFLYNTLDSIIWMVEGERNEEAAFMISELAKLFRISLSKGRTVIRVKDNSEFLPMLVPNFDGGEIEKFSLDYNNGTLNLYVHVITTL